MQRTLNLTVASTIVGLKELWQETLGKPDVCVAILDGQVAKSHSCLANAKLTQIETLVSDRVEQGQALQHGTHIASIIFGQHNSSVKGIATNCRGLIVPIFTNGDGGSLAPCSQIDLARAIVQAVQHKANIINISSGQLTPSGEAYPILADAVRYCSENNVLIVAAAGNDGCNCLHIPGALPSVLAVGAMNSQGIPLDFSNWGDRYQTQGILAPGENILGATPNGGTAVRSGTSYATPIVSGIAALLMSLQLKQGQKLNSHAVRAALLKSAIACEKEPSPDCRRLLAGRLNIKGAMSLILQRGDFMSDQNTGLENTQLPPSTEADESQSAVTQMAMNSVQAASYSGDRHQITTSSSPQSAVITPDRTNDNVIEYSSVVPSSIKPSECGCGGGGPAQLVYALGLLGYDFGTEARRDSFVQQMGEGSNPNDPSQLLTHLEDNSWAAASINWTLNLDATPIYAIQSQGAFASDVYRRLRQFLREQLEEGVERVSIPGMIMGQVMLMSGQVVPIIQPNLRCMYSWNVAALLEAVCGSPPSESDRDGEDYDRRCQAVGNFLERVYYELRNLGIMPQERAINYAATNAFNVEQIFADAIRQEMELDTIEVERSPLCRPDSDCWDVKLTFFNPSRVFEQARKIYRFTIDVSDVCPVTVGKVRSWSVR
ncbi:MAG: PatA/PatG family cyanobactin maturation protease [Pleurocapsa sp.]